MQFCAIMYLIFAITGECHMDGNLWERSLNVLKFDDRINNVLYDTILMKMEQVHYDNGILVLSCRDEYSLTVVKGKDLRKYINDAVNAVSDSNVTVNYILKDDVNALRTTIIGTTRANETNNTSDHSSEISSEYTFKNFIVGDCNRFAHASAVAVANNPGASQQRNPLYLWGNSGLGKTHLMKAIGNFVLENHRSMNVLYTTCEEFTNAYVSCMKNKNYEAFRNKYRTVDVLLIDDIQFLIGKEGTQLEFFNTFESLINSGKQIVITSDKAPKNLTELDSRLTSRFQNGMTMDIQPPDFETRKAIIISKLEREHIDISDDIINYICENMTKNVRELNGAFNIVSSYYALTNGNLDLEDVKKCLASLISPGGTKTITPEMIIDAVSKYYDISPDKMKSNVRNAEVVNARNVAMYLCRDINGTQLNAIGQYFGGKKHSTVLHSCNIVSSNDALMADVENIKKRITDY